MTRLHLVRIWRDGSVLFIALFATIAIAPAVLAAPSQDGGGVIAVTQVLTFVSAILAMNWSYYERENLWIALTAGQGVGSYFRGFLLSLASIGLLLSLGFLAILGMSRAARLPLADVALPVAAPVVAAIAAAALLTRIKLKPSAFSPAILGLLIVVEIAGFFGGLAAQVLILVTGVLTDFAAVAQAIALAAYVAAMATFGLWSVTKLAAGFRL